LLDEVRQSVLDAFEHQDYPFSTLVERLQAARDPSRSPIFQVMFSMHKALLPGDEGLALFALGEADARMNLGGLELTSVPLKRRVAQFDLTLMMAEAGEELYASFEYNTALFEAATIKQMAQSFRTLLDAVVANPAERISRLPLLPREDLSLNAQRRKARNIFFRNKPFISCLSDRLRRRRRPSPSCLANSTFLIENLTNGQTSWRDILDGSELDRRRLSRSTWNAVPKCSSDCWQFSKPAVRMFRWTLPIRRSEQSFSLTTRE
jgi:non-ribosomal peptide synthetase component F